MTSLKENQAVKLDCKDVFVRRAALHSRFRLNSFVQNKNLQFLGGRGVGGRCCMKRHKA